MRLRQLLRLLRTTSLFLVTAFSALSCNMHDKADTFITPSGDKLVITPIKHASVQIDYKGRNYQIDPVCSNVEPIVEYTDKPKADFIILTDFHDDHFDSYAIHLLRKRDTQVLLNKRSYQRLGRKFGIVMKYGDTAQLGDGVSVTAVPAYNTTKDYVQIRPKGAGNGYIFNFDGFRVYIAGDTEPIPAMKKLGKIDVAFLPCNQPYTMNLKQIGDAARMIKPKVLYPYNWNKTPENSIRRALAGLKGIDVRIRYFK